VSALPKTRFCFCWSAVTLDRSNGQALPSKLQHPLQEIPFKLPGSGNSLPTTRRRLRCHWNSLSTTKLRWLVQARSIAIILLCLLGLQKEKMINQLKVINSYGVLFMIMKYSEVFKYNKILQAVASTGKRWQVQNI
jgi:hypothetical protein